MILQKLVIEIFGCFPVLQIEYIYLLDMCFAICSIIG